MLKKTKTLCKLVFQIPNVMGELMLNCAKQWRHPINYPEIVSYVEADKLEDLYDDLISKKANYIK